MTNDQTDIYSPLCIAMINLNQRVTARAGAIMFGLECGDITAKQFQKMKDTAALGEETIESKIEIIALLIVDTSISMIQEDKELFNADTY